MGFNGVYNGIIIHVYWKNNGIVIYQPENGDLIVVKSPFIVVKNIVVSSG